MSRIQRDYYYYPPPFSPATISSPTNHSSSSSSSSSKISPAVLFIIVILAVLFFISGLLHLLVRFLVKKPFSSSSQSPQQSSSSPGNRNQLSTSEALQRQLQQLFHLHDSGLDQAFIDALPVFRYREIVGLNNKHRRRFEFDCAVCLSEFSDKDKLRLLPVCSHAFHLSCIDTWLLSNSTCPLCRGTLFSENPVFGDFDDFAENPENGEQEDSVSKRVEIEEVKVKVKGVLPVRLGKFRRVGPPREEEEEESNSNAIGESSSSRLDARRCFSMGSYEYVLGDSVLRVPLRVGDSNNDDNGNNRRSGDGVGDLEGKKIGSGESYSVSKIWLWSKKGKFSSSSSNNGLPVSLGADLPWMGKRTTTPGL